MVKATKITKEDELLLQSFSSTAAINSTSHFAMFFIMAVGAVLPPLYLFYGVNQMDLYESGPFLGVAAIASIYALIFAYKTSTQTYKPKIERQRGDAIAREVNREFSDDKKVSKSEKEERILFKTSEHAAKEAAAFAILFNNVIFTVICLVFSFFVFANFSPNFNCVLSTAGAAGLVALFSTSK